MFSSTRSGKNKKVRESLEGRNDEDSNERHIEDLNGDDISSSSNDQLLVDTGITSRQKRNKNPPLLDKFVAWMPVDIFAEVCSHLEGKNLIYLTRVSKWFRAILLGPGGQQIWKDARLNNGIPDLKVQMSEYAYAMLIYFEVCSVCQAKDINSGNYWTLRGQGTNFFLKTRLCRTCYEDRVISSRTYSFGRLVLHPRTTICVASSWRKKYGDSNGFERGTEYLRHDLEVISKRLFELQAIDDANVKDYSLDTGPAASLVMQFVAERLTIVGHYLEDGFELLKLPEKLEALTKQFNRIRKQQNDRIFAQQVDARYQQIEREAVARGFTSEELSWTRNIPELVGFFVQTTPLFFDDWKLWEFQSHLDLARAHTLQESRKSAIKDRYKILYAGQIDSATSSTFPLLRDFLELPSILALWEKDGLRIVDDQIWTTQLPRIIQDMDVLREKNRIAVIRMVLVANNQIIESKKKSTEFTTSTYDDSFFNKSISILACEFCAKAEDENPCYAPYPAIHLHQLEDHADVEYNGLRKGRKINYSTSSKQVEGLKKLFIAASFDVLTSTLEELEALGPRFWYTGWRGKGSGKGTASQILDLYTSSILSRGDAAHADILLLNF